MVQVTVAGYILSMSDMLPGVGNSKCQHATLVERFGFASHDEQAPVMHLSVQRGDEWPFLCVEQHYWPGASAGSVPGVYLAPETHLLFIGAGERLLAYDLRATRRLWEDKADCGFHTWECHDDMIVMSAELELAAWDIQGVKLWSTFVEPPWTYQVEKGIVELTVMGTVSSFPLLTGPSSR
jgi:hypothetical protein